MDDLDLKLIAWREATENLEPAPETMASLHEAIDRLPLQGPSKVRWLIAFLVLGVLTLGGLFVWLLLNVGA